MWIPARRSRNQRSGQLLNLAFELNFPDDAGFVGRDGKSSRIPEGKVGRIIRKIIFAAPYCRPESRFDLLRDLGIIGGNLRVIMRDGSRD